MADEIKNKPHSFTKRKIVIEKKRQKIYKEESPRNNRAIAERSGIRAQIDTPVLVSFLSGIVLLGIIVIGLHLLNDIRTLSSMKTLHEKQEKELVYWETITSKYPDYRDAYLRESAVAKSLGNTELAQEAYTKALAIDPNLK